MDKWPLPIGVVIDLPRASRERSCHCYCSIRESRDRYKLLPCRRPEAHHPALLFLVEGAPPLGVDRRLYRLSQLLKPLHMSRPPHRHPRVRQVSWVDSLPSSKRRYGKRCPDRLCVPSKTIRRHLPPRPTLPLFPRPPPWESQFHPVCECFILHSPMSIIYARMGGWEKGGVFFSFFFTVA